MVLLPTIIVLNLETILEEKLIPWSNSAEERIIVARPRMHLAMMPAGVQLEKRALTGKRVIVTNRRHYHNTRGITASWPSCGLSEVQLLKLVCILTGHVDYQLSRQAVLCGPGHFIFIPPGLPHPEGVQNIIDLHKSTFCEILYFHLYPTALQCWISGYTANEKRRPLGNYLFQHQYLLQLFRMMMDETITNVEETSQVSGNLMRAFFCLLKAKLQAGLFQEATSGEINPAFLNKRDPDDFPSALRQYIQSHLQERPTLEDAARHMCLSRTQFAHRVKTETGKTFVALLNEYRIETAQKLLRNSDWTITTIATFLGYRSPHYFQILFLERTGVTPGQYRRNEQKNVR